MRVDRAPPSASVHPASQQIAPALLGVPLGLVLPADFRRVGIGPDRSLAGHVEAAGIGRQRARRLGILIAITRRLMGLCDGGARAHGQRRGDRE